MNQILSKTLLGSAVATALLMTAQAAESPNLIDDGGFEASDVVNPSASWGPNPTYPGRIEIITDKAKAHGGERFLHVQTPAEPADPHMGTGVVVNKKIPRTVEHYRYRLFCRGEAKVCVTLSAWGKTKWICTTPGSKWHTVDTPNDWSSVEGTIRVPDQLPYAGQPDTKESVAELQLVIYVRGEADLDDVVIEAGQ